ncbi:M48 family metallopeptidase [Pleionea sp. CnH1-48]|uniref:M48 family metallopeptidase n=1 Tax=Pleionea sp. CnH1-48 TaxID=2954494 RepID=UPI0020970DE3|nr:M48 family metallopeptidase [Pleionea sp. CnH1-48]MCO7222808.1 M48 family metallopeptidase [Pleionea sp. CnH1-48]
MSHKVYTIITIAILSLLIASCAVSPTGRKQMLIYSKGQMSQMGITAYDSMKNEGKLVKDARVNQYVRCVTDALLQHIPAGLSGENWEVSVFSDDTPNAFALPGAKIGIHTGMLKVAEKSGQLAAVVGHEIGHVWADHGNERMSQQTLAQAGLQMVAVLAGEPSTQKNMAMSALGIATQGVVLKFSRDQESEADTIGLEMMAKAGFNPQEAVNLWRRMAEQSQGSNVPEFMSTHPSEATRIERLSQQLSKVMPLYHQARGVGANPQCRPPKV